MTKKPFYTQINIFEKKLDNSNEESVVTLGDMASLFADSKTARLNADKIIYRVFKRTVDTEQGELLQCTTEILEGTCGGELYMTRGHGHICKDCAEIYIGITGKGLIFMQNKTEFRCEELMPGKAIYIPGGWNHRSINISKTESLLFYSIWPAQSGYNYAALKKMPFEYRAYSDVSGYRLQRVL